MSGRTFHCNKKRKENDNIQNTKFLFVCLFLVVVFLWYIYLGLLVRSFSFVVASNRFHQVEELS